MQPLQEDCIDGLYGANQEEILKWIKSKGSEFSKFYWQNGYGAFSVNPKDVVTVVQYILNQRQHHQKKSFREEYLTFLELHEIPYDERYVWD